MQALSNKQIVLGISGGIAAYKCGELVRRLRDHGASVRVVMTAGGQQFITPLTMQALSGNPVHCDLLDPETEAGMGHIELARWADLVLIAPASADTLASLRQGRADDLLGALVLACEAPLAVAPAMNQAMWNDAATQQNVEALSARGVQIWGPDSGSQACGDTGPGRMLETADLLAHIDACFAPGLLAGRRLLITAGPTRERIDPVRYISNFSSGRMGFALAQTAAENGARVQLVCGPVALDTPERVQRINVESAQEMHEVVLAQAADNEVFIAAAAVADYRPVSVSEDKIKKNSESMHLQLERNPDILADVASLSERPLCVGFAAESGNLEQYARDKLRRKGLDLIVGNRIDQAGIGFDSAENAVTLIYADGRARELLQASKIRIAQQIIQAIAELLPGATRH